MPQPCSAWRVYVGEELDTPAAVGESGAGDVGRSPTGSVSQTARLLDSAFARRSRHTLQTVSAALRQQPSAAPSPVLRWMLLQEQRQQQQPSPSPTTDATRSHAGEAGGATRPHSSTSPATSATVVATAAVSALARRGVGPTDPLQQRLLKRKLAASAPPSSDTSATADDRSSTRERVSSGSHWTQHPLSAMTPISWKVFRQQLGITVELVAPSQPPPPEQQQQQQQQTRTSGASESLPPADTLAAMRCWEEAQLPLSLGRCVTHAYALPTAVQAQCVPLAMLPRPPSSTTATATALGVDVLAVAETGSGKTAAYLVPLLYHVLCRAPRLLGDRELISHGPLSMVVVPTRELAEQVTVALLQLSGQAAATSHHNHNSGSTGAGAGSLTPAVIRAWEAQEADVGDSGRQDGTNTAAAPRNRLSELRVVRVVGGESRDAQYTALAGGAHCVVGTVGQLQALLEDRLLSLSNTRFIVVDEADRMVDEQQEERLTAVLERCPAHRQTLLFTATLSAACAAVAQRYMAKSGYYVVRTPYRCASIRQSFELVADTADAATAGEATAAGEDAQQSPTPPPPRQQRRIERGGPPARPPQQQQQRRLSRLIHPLKFARLVSWLVYGTGPIIVFANGKATCDALWEELRAEAEHLDTLQEFFTIEDIVGPAPDGLVFREAVAGSGGGGVAAAAAAPRRTPSLVNLTSVAVVHAELSQAERRSLVSQFHRRQRQVLLTTDLLARGLDVAGVTLVVNYDVPWVAATTTTTSSTAASSDAVSLYIHRIGRTGRAGSTGVAVTFVALPAAMVQRAEEVADGESGGGGGRRGTWEKQQSSSAAADSAATGDDGRAALGELFDGDVQNVWMAGAVAATSTSDGAQRRRGRGRDEDGGSSGGEEMDSDGADSDEVRQDSDDDGDADDDATAGHARRAVNGAKVTSSAAAKRRRRRAAVSFASDVAVLRPLWAFLIECAEGEGCRDGAVALRRGTYAKISMPPALACIMAQLSATSQYGRITL
ncbi:ATP-dependent RNA helicase [Novymonas esmeraldas]|uniref:RNA helicase n=1 Tax=Novymonas esmeraldas TaxID=1808958 RepID=A0AAW0ERQ1_9TRYP